MPDFTVHSQKVNMNASEDNSLNQSQEFERHTEKNKTQLYKKREQSRVNDIGFMDNYSSDI